MSKEEIIQKVTQHAQAETGFDGVITPEVANTIIEQYQDSAEVFLVDVRTNEERVFTGYVPHSVHVAWATGTSFTRNPRFVRELESKTGKDKIVLLLCRSGNRSRQAAVAAKAAGFNHVFNIAEGFEGDLAENGQRNTTNGWKYHKLPWIQA
jgi:rhodanese-related sulfurtransferase